MSLFLVPMDALLIEQVIINLLENALKHSHSKKPIELYATIEPKTVTVYVKDYGIGISNDKKMRYLSLIPAETTALTGTRVWALGFLFARLL